MKILIGADICPTKNNQSIFESGGGEMEKIVDTNLLKVLALADYRIFNLECPLTDKQSPIEKCGSNLRVPSASVKGIKALGVNFVTLANNHIMDHGVQGLHSTMKVLQNAGIAYAGVGENLQEAQRPYIVTLGGKRVGIYCCAEHEFSIAEKNKPGANPFEPLDSLDHIAELKGKCDYVICLYHGGKEDYCYPSPYLQRVCRKIVEKGADLVLCQHSHCIGCKEVHKGGTIVYGQGNFLFNSDYSELRYTSLLLSVDIRSKEITYIPLQQTSNGVKLARETDAQKILNAFHKRTEDILKDGFVDSEYAKFAKSMIAGYVVSNSWLYDTILFRGINKISQNRLRKWIANRAVKRYWARMLNRYECEAHRELIMRGLVDKHR